MNARKPMVAMLASLGALAGACLLWSAPALACPNEASRQGPSLNLPECRVYEQVTPVNKGDTIEVFSVGRELIPNSHDKAYAAENGEAILVETEASIGPNAPVLQAAYVFARGAEGWHTDTVAPALDAPQYVNTEVFDPATLSAVGFHDLSGTFNELESGDPNAFRKVNLVGPVGSTGAAFSSLYSASGAAANENNVHLVGGSEDLSHVFAESENHALVPAAKAQAPGSYAVYEWSGGGECGLATSHCTLVDVNGKGEAMPCGAILGVASGTEGDEGGAYKAVSSNGARVFLTAPSPGTTSVATPVGPGCWNPHTFPEENPPQVYIRELREGVPRMVEISQPEEGVKITTENPMQVAVFVGASRDGSKAFFITKTELTKDDTGHAPELYEYNAEPGPGEKTLTRISHGESGTAEGNVDYVGPVSSDGSTIYFTAFGDLATGAKAYTEAGEWDSPVNLYRYDTVTGTTTFITTLGKCEPVGCGEGSFGAPPYSQEFENHAGFSNEYPWQEWYTTGDGQFLLFESQRPITGFDNTGSKAADAILCDNGSNNGGHNPDACRELFRYDAATGSIVCVSCAGGLPINDASFSRTPLNTGMNGPQRPISENGEVVAFETANALVSQAAPGKLHVYEWHDGTTSLVSSPNDPGDAFYLGMSADGSNIFFASVAQLAPQDTDQSYDVYDARADGGFVGVAAPQCSGTSCQGIPAAPPIFATPASVTFEGVGNFLPGTSGVSTPPPPKPVAKPVKCRRGFVAKHGRCVKRRARKTRRAKKSAKGRK